MLGRTGIGHSRRLDRRAGRVCPGGRRPGAAPRPLAPLRGGLRLPARPGAAGGPARPPQVDSARPQPGGLAQPRWRGSLALRGLPQPRPRPGPTASPGPRRLSAATSPAARGSAARAQPPGFRAGRGLPGVRPPRCGQRHRREPLRRRPGLRRARLAARPRRRRPVHPARRPARILLRLAAAGFRARGPERPPRLRRGPRDLAGWRLPSRRLRLASRRVAPRPCPGRPEQPLAGLLGRLRHRPGARPRRGAPRRSALPRPRARGRRLRPGGRHRAPPHPRGAALRRGGPLGLGRGGGLAVRLPAPSGGPHPGLDRRLGPGLHPRRAALVAPARRQDRHRQRRRRPTRPHPGHLQPALPQAALLQRGLLGVPGQRRRPEPERHARPGRRRVPAAGLEPAVAPPPRRRLLRPPRCSSRLRARRDAGAGRSGSSSMPSPNGKPRATWWSAPSTCASSRAGRCRRPADATPTSSAAPWRSGSGARGVSAPHRSCGPGARSSPANGQYRAGHHRA